MQEVTPEVKRPGKEAFVWDLLVRLIAAKRWDIHSVTIEQIRRGRNYGISRKTMWATVKELEEQGYVQHTYPKSKTFRMTDSAWEPIKAEIIKFKLVKKE